MQVTLNPEGEAADAQRQWWESEGPDATLTPLGQATGGVGGLSGAGARQNKLQFLEEVVVSYAVVNWVWYIWYSLLIQQQLHCGRLLLHRPQIAVLRPFCCTV